MIPFWLVARCTHPHVTSLATLSHHIAVPHTPQIVMLHIRVPYTLNSEAHLTMFALWIHLWDQLMSRRNFFCPRVLMRIDLEEGVLGCYFTSLFTRIRPSNLWVSQRTFVIFIAQSVGLDWACWNGYGLPLTIDLFKYFSLLSTT